MLTQTYASQSIEGFAFAINYQLLQLLCVVDALLLLGFYLAPVYFSLLLISEEFLRSHFTSTENGTSLSAHGAQVAPSGHPLGGANL
jgi:hypothetical protein